MQSAGNCRAAPGSAAGCALPSSYCSESQRLTRAWSRARCARYLHRRMQARARGAGLPGRFVSRMLPQGHRTHAGGQGGRAGDPPFPPTSLAQDQEHQPDGAPERGSQTLHKGGGDLPQRRGQPRLVGAVLLEQDEHWQPAGRRMFSAESMAVIPSLDALKPQASLQGAAI